MPTRAARTAVSVAVLATSLVAVGMAPAAPAAAAEAADFDPTECEPAQSAVGFTLPSWGDAQWSDPATYSTIQTADLDGDGLSELFARTPIGLEVHSFDTTTGQWEVRLGEDAPFSDAAGWQRPKYYSTIQSGDVDGDGRAEIFARADDGMDFYRFDPGTGTWSSPSDLNSLSSSLGAFVGDPGAALRASYSTIQAADLDGDGDDELVGRIGNGIRAYDFTGSGWTELAQLPWLPDQGDFARPDVYDTFQAGDLTDDPGEELFARTPQGMTGFSYAPGSGWTPLPDSDGLFGDADTGGPWLLPEHYETIQAADVDGDERDEVIARSVTGIVVHEVDDDGWTAGTPLKASFTDAGGYAQEKYYAAIQATDLDGDGWEEVIGRSAQGLQAWSLHRSRGKWTAVVDPTEADPGVFSDAVGADVPRTYLTIQSSGDIDGFAPLGTSTQTRSEIIGRGPTGIETYRFDQRSGSFVSPSVDFPDYSQGTEKKAYQAINTALATNPVNGTVNPDFGDVRDNYPTAEVGQFTQWQSVVSGLSRPKSVGKGTWKDVREQILDELAYGFQVATWWDEYQQDAILDTFTVENLDSTPSWLTDQFQSDRKVDASIFDAVAKVAGTVLQVVGAATAEPEISIAANILTSAISSGLTVSTNEAIKESNVTFNEVRDHLSDAFDEALCGNDRARRTVMGDYGLLAIAAGSIDNDSWQHVPIDPSRTRAGFSTWVWQSFASLIDMEVGWCEPTDTDPTCYTTEPGYTYKVTTGSSDPSVLFEPFEPGCDDWADDSTGQEDCGLGVSKEVLYRGLDGWDLPCDAGTVNRCDQLTAFQEAWYE
jgi:hypothetical protein